MTKPPTPKELTNLIDMIRHGRLNARGERIPIDLAQMTKNIQRHSGLSEEDRTLLLEKVHVALRQINTRKANELFGAKDVEAKDTLDRIYEYISAKYDFSQNVVNNGVKIGGDMIAGRVYVDVYFSYKNTDKWHTTFAWIQDEPASEAYLKIANYWSGRDNSSLTEKKYTLSEEEQAILHYEEFLNRTHFLQGRSNA